ncbi:MAG: hypothetical protein NTV34_06935, partial [Proteobacteria bacterium]|nr:hypothetical protein [Pseudomonadota bacterium]
MKQEQPKKQIQEKLKTVPREIPAWAEGFLTKDVLSQIETAVKAGEQKTSGEIVPVLVRASSSEHSARRVLALILVSALLVLVPLLGLNDYNWFNFLGELLGLLLGLVGIYWLPMPASFLRFLVPTREQILRVDHRAELEFYRSRIQQTSGHTGILLFVSLAERRAVVLADKGISEKLPQ